MHASTQPADKGMYCWPLNLQLQLLASLIITTVTSQSSMSAMLQKIFLSEAAIHPMHCQAELHINQELWEFNCSETFNQSQQQDRPCIILLSGISPSSIPNHFNLKT